VFALGSIFETFGIVYIEAMAMGLPVVCTNHPNQRSVVREGLFIDMKRPGALADALTCHSREDLSELGRRGRRVAERYYDIAVLKHEYLRRYTIIAAAPAALPRRTWSARVEANLRNAARWPLRFTGRRARE
jgi:glycosyltransferase involved in cell wall biosynthesis